MLRFGIKRTLICALLVMAASSAASALMTQSWQLILTWGVFSGLSSGCVAMVLGAAVVNRWFVTRRGLVMGLLSASAATGTLIFLPGLAAIAEHVGWRAVVLTVGGAALALVPVALILLPESPERARVTPYGAGPDWKPQPAGAGNPLKAAIDAMVFAGRKKDFWLLFATFFVCGFTTNGLVGTHMISLCADHGLPEVRKLLFAYYALRGLSLIYLPFSDFRCSA
jgi:MFS family permease